MKVAIVSLLALFSLVIVSGCIYSDDQIISGIVKASPIVKEFTDQYPNAELKMTRFTTEQTTGIIDQIRSECGNNYLQPGNYYRVNITDKASGLLILAWVNLDNRTIECLLKTGGGGPSCRSHAEAKCYGGHVYWFDSCGKKEDKKEYCTNDCENGFCRSKGNCTLHTETKCSEGHVYWYDSCGNRQEKKEYCKNGCEEGKCKIVGNEDCTDSDGGVNTNKKGCAVKGDNELCDHCNDNGTLTEKYCENNEIVWKSVSCPDGYECEDGACVASSNCTSHSEAKCYEGHVYWYDSCGNKQEKKQYCNQGCQNDACLECTSHNQTKCYNSDVYWYDSCNSKEEKKEDCVYGCDGGQCLNYPSANCSGFIYFTFRGFELTPNSTLLDVKNGNISVTITGMKVNDLNVTLASPVNITLADANETISGAVVVGKTQGQEYSYSVAVYYMETNETLVDDAVCAGLIK